MQMGQTGDRTADLQVGGRPLYPSATAALRSSQRRSGCSRLALSCMRRRRRREGQGLVSAAEHVGGANAEKLRQAYYVLVMDVAEEEAISSCHQIPEEASDQTPLSDCKTPAARLGGSRH
ncbi:unnamed protein product [Pleuronectes platessa]|uniref:Uncharacterized protein n=1 Tax=Pleuronectes platessa TaxID=8262 RepID=A0A9N7UYK2_PLEPL|nr:unnamed protein product [Pleuronectes platessa]